MSLDIEANIDIGADVEVEVDVEAEVEIEVEVEGGLDIDGQIDCEVEMDAQADLEIEVDVPAIDIDVNLRGNKDVVIEIGGSGDASASGVCGKACCCIFSVILFTILCIACYGAGSYLIYLSLLSSKTNILTLTIGIVLEACGILFMVLTFVSCCGMRKSKGHAQGEIEAGGAVEIEIAQVEIQADVNLEAPLVEVEVEIEAPEIEVEVDVDIEIDAPVIEAEVEVEAPVIEEEVEVEVEAEIDVEAPKVDVEVDVESPQVEVDIQLDEVEIEAPVVDVNADLNLGGDYNMEIEVGGSGDASASGGCGKACCCLFSVILFTILCFACYGVGSYFVYLAFLSDKTFMFNITIGAILEACGLLFMILMCVSSCGMRKAKGQTPCCCGGSSETNINVQRGIEMGGNMEVEVEVEVVPEIDCDATIGLDLEIGADVTVEVEAPQIDVEIGADVEVEVEVEVDVEVEVEVEVEG